MTNDELKVIVQQIVPVKYIYIQDVPYATKGLRTYNIYFNSRIKNAKLSLTSIDNQNIFLTYRISGESISALSAHNPILLDEYTRPILDNSILNLIDLAGDYLASDKNL